MLITRITLSKYSGYQHAGNIINKSIKFTIKKNNPVVLRKGSTLLISISLFSNSQKTDIIAGFSNQIGTSSPHFSYGFLCDPGFRFTNKISIYSGIETNFIKYTQKGVVFTDPYGYSGDISINHTIAFYGFPLFLTYKLYSSGKLNIDGKAGILNTFLYDYYNGNPDSKGIFGKGIEKQGYFLFGITGLSLDYMFSERTGFLLTEQFLFSNYYSANSNKYYYNTQFGIKYRIK